MLKRLYPGRHSVRGSKHTHIVRYDDGVVVVGVPNEFVKDWLFNKYHKIILKSLRELAEGVRGLEYIVSVGANNEQVAASARVFHQPANSALPLDDLYVDKKTI